MSVNEVSKGELAEVIAQTDDCIDCEGTGQEVARYDATGEPTEFQTCYRCGCIAADILAAFHVTRREGTR